MKIKIFSFLLICSALALILGAAIGSVYIPPFEVAQIIAHNLTGFLGGELDEFIDALKIAKKNEELQSS